MQTVFRVMILIIAFFLVSCKEDIWSGFVYPDKDDLFDYRDLGDFKTVENCKNAAKAELKKMYAEQKGYYQCGKNCISKAGLKTVAACEDIVH